MISAASARAASCAHRHSVGYASSSSERIINADASFNCSRTYSSPDSALVSPVSSRRSSSAAARISGVMRYVLPSHGLSAFDARTIGRPSRLTLSPSLEADSRFAFGSGFIDAASSVATAADPVSIVPPDIGNPIATSSSGHSGASTSHATACRGNPESRRLSASRNFSSGSLGTILNLAIEVTLRKCAERSHSPRRQTRRCVPNRLRCTPRCGHR